MLNAYRNTGSVQEIRRAIVPGMWSAPLKSDRGILGYSSRFHVRRIGQLLLLVAATLCCAPIFLQAQLASLSPVRITLGHSIVALNGPWKFHVGDNPKWAASEFDDSGWETVNLGPKNGSVDPNFGISGYVPGWTALGHPGYSGYAWYRIHIEVTDPDVEVLILRDRRLSVSSTLAIVAPSNVDDAYQIYANGSLLGSFGRFPAASGQPTVYNSQPRMFVLPGLADGAGREEVVLAFRLWMEPQTLTMNSDTGGLHGAPLLGEVGEVAAHYRLSWIEILRSYALAPLLAVLFLLMAVLACTLILFDRSDPVYLWLAGVFLLVSLSNVNLCIGAWAQIESLATLQLSVLVFWSPLILGGWVMVWWQWFRLQRPVWIPSVLAALTLLYMLSQALGSDFFAVPHPIAAVFHGVSIGVRLLFLSLLVLIVRWGLRQQGREAWLALPAVVLAGIAQFQNELQVLRLTITWFLFGVQISLAALANLVLLAAISVLLLRRVLLSMRRQRETALDIRQAQEMQRVLIPEDTPKVPGLLIESEYLPAREVGGDFFQIVPNSRDGSALLVVGDVTGKGLQAGMLVALLVGAIRNQAESSFDPLEMMESLNRRLCGRGSAHATCLAMLIESDGNVTLANAGHLAPWLNGREMEMKGALPLGMIPGAEFPVMRFQMTEGDCLYLMSDGVAEAQNLRNELFGFERIEAMLRIPGTAVTLANAAQAFGRDRTADHGQADDILVLRVVKESQPSA